MKFARHLNNVGWTAVWRVVRIDEHPKTYSTKTRGREPSGASENTIFYEEIPLQSIVPNQWFLFA